MGRMLNSIRGQGAGSVGRKRFWAEEASCAFIHFTDIYDVPMCSALSLPADPKEYAV